MLEPRVLTLHPYLLHNACWVFDDPRTGLKEEAFVRGMSEMIFRVVEAKRLPDAARGFTMLFADQPFPGHDVELRWLRPDADGGNWYEGTVMGEPMQGWLCPALLLYFQSPPERIFVRCEPLPAGVDPVWEPGPGETTRRFVEAPRAAAIGPGASYSQIVSQLKELEGKTDPESHELFMKLIDELMCVDMALQPYRRAMGSSENKTS